ncbi:hypothetical protein GW17_00033309 [Ensete ventricosum]|nr:hypothetical protein GW17_00033309 [Ensete ventricosum]RZS06711.1 hypothetical protein BHM03_00037416 [Ensete ventricosum]
MHIVCMQKWLATAKPPAWAAGHGLATCKGRPAMVKAPMQGGDRLRPCPLQGAAAHKGQQPTRDGHSQGQQPLAAKPQGAAARGALARGNRQRPALPRVGSASPATSRSDDAGHKGQPPLA